MKKLFLITLLFTLNTFAQKSTPPMDRLYHLKSLITKISQEEVVKDLRDFIKAGRPSRLVGTTGHDKSVSFLLDKIKMYDPELKGKASVDEFIPDTKAAIDFYENDFKNKIEGRFAISSPEYKNWKNFTKSITETIKKHSHVKGKNIVWEKKGLSDKTLIIAANYDTINIDPKTNMLVLNEEMPGADKNGTGVVTLLHLIKQLSKLELKKSVKIVFLDYQSFGFLGGHALYEKVKKEKDNIEGFIEIEMIGNDSKVFDKEARFGNMQMYFSTPDTKTYEKESALSNTFIKAGKDTAPEITFTPRPIGFEYSDNIIFSNGEIPAIVFTQNWDTDFNSTRYHTKNDFVETINRNTFHKSLQYILASVISFLMEITK